MNAAGIDVSKGKSMVSVMRPLGEVVAKPFTVHHTGSELKELADYEKMLNSVERIYRKHLDRLEDLVILSGKTDWQQYSDQEKQLTENTALLVGLLFQMCKVQLVLTAEGFAGEPGLNEVNHKEVEQTLLNARSFMDKKGFPILA